MLPEDGAMWRHVTVGLQSLATAEHLATSDALAECEQVDLMHVQLKIVIQSVRSRTLVWPQGRLHGLQVAKGWTVAIAPARH